MDFFKYMMHCNVFVQFLKQPNFLNYFKIKHTALPRWFVLFLNNCILTLGRVPVNASY